MTDELTIQPQVQQKQGNYAVPGAIAGAVVGGVAGANAHRMGISGVQTKYSSYEDILKESEDTFKSQIEKGGDNKGAWETAQDWKKKIDNYEADYNAKVDEVKKAGGTIAATELPDGDVKNTLNRAQTAYDNALKAEKAKYSTGSGTGIVTKDIKPFSKLSRENLPLTYAFGNHRGSEIPIAQVESLYNSMVSDVTNAERTMEVKLNNGIRKNKKVQTDKIQTYFDSEYGSLKGKSDEELSKYYSQKTKTRNLFGFKSEVPTPQYTKALNIAAQQYPEVTTATLPNERYLEFGREIAPGESLEKGEIIRRFSVKDPATGRNITKNVAYKQADLDNFVEKLNEDIRAKQTAAADRMFENAYKTVLLKKQEAGLVDEVARSIHADLADKTGFYDKSKDSLDLKKIIGESKTYDNDLKALNAAKKAGTGMPATGASFAAGTTVDDAIQQLQARKRVLKAYNGRLNAIQAEMAEAMKSNPIVEEFDAKIAEKIANDPAVNKAKARLAEQFPQVFPNGGATLTESEIASKAETALKDKQVAKDLQAAKDAAKAELEKLGKSVGELSGDDLAKALKDKGIAATAADYKKGLEEQAKAAIEKDLGKFKTPNKWANGVIAGIALAAAGLGIGYSMKKDA